MSAGTGPTPNPVGALSEIDRLGQAVLESLWKENELYGPNIEAMRRLMEGAKGHDPEVVMAELQRLMGLDSIEGAVTHMLNMMTAQANRKQAVTQYLSGRRLLTNAGLI